MGAVWDAPSRRLEGKRINSKPTEKKICEAERSEAGTESGEKGLQRKLLILYEAN